MFGYGDMYSPLFFPQSIESPQCTDFHPRATPVFLCVSVAGAVNPSARMPLTTYPPEYLAKLNKTIADFDVSVGVGRTYRYLDEKDITPVYR